MLDVRALCWSCTSQARRMCGQIISRNKLNRFKSKPLAAVSRSASSRRRSFISCVLGGGKILWPRKKCGDSPFQITLQDLGRYTGKPWTKSLLKSTKALCLCLSVTAKALILFPARNPHAKGDRGERPQPPARTGLL